MEAHLRKEWPAIPALALLQISREQLRVRGEAIVRQLVSLPLRLRLVESETEVGGGALPRSRIGSIALGLRPERFSPNELAIRLRQGTPAVVGYISGGEVRLDLRTILPAQDELLAGALRTCLERP
jgi:L-seryl-tRNA(Ser) seleniumtransferase